MAKNNWGFDLQPSIWKTQELFNKLDFSIPVLEMSKAIECSMSKINLDIMDSALKMSRALEGSMPKYNLDGIASALKDFSGIPNLFSDVSISARAVQELTDTMEVFSTVKISSIAESILPQVDASAFDILKQSAVLESFAKVDWSWISESYPEEDEEDSEHDDHGYAEELATAEIRAEIASDISQVLTNPSQAQELSQSKYIKWKEQHPFLADLYLGLLLPILAWVLSFSAETVVGLANKNAKVYDEPSASSNIVYNITVEQNVTVIGDVKYYYEVEIPDPVTGKTVIGYVYKGNLVIPETQSDEVEQEGQAVARSKAKKTTTVSQVALSE